MGVVTIKVETEVYETREPNPDDRWDHGDTRGHVTGVKAHITDKPADPTFYRAESFEVDAGVGDWVYVVVADYESGDTFGRSGGYFQVLDVFTDAAHATALVQAAQQVKKSQYVFLCNDREYHVSWTGYFEELQDIVPHFVQVQL